MSQLLTETERKATAYLFQQLQAIYPDKFTLVWPTEAHLNATKRFYAEGIGMLSKEEIDTTLGIIFNHAMRGEKGYDRPSMILFFQHAKQLRDSRRREQAEAKRIAEENARRLAYDNLPEEEKERRRKKCDEARAMIKSLLRGERIEGDSHERG